MIVTQNLKNRVSLAKANGYTHISSICSHHKATTYRHYIGVDEVLNSSIGTNFSYGRYNGITSTLFRKNNIDAIPISYTTLFKNEI